MENETETISNCSICTYLEEDSEGNSVCEALGKIMITPKNSSCSKFRKNPRVDKK